MAIGPGARLGPYDVGALVGEGGMGQVYRATDTQLKRTVALKVLPPAVAGDASRLARFQREAEMLARVNHPNIAQIYGLEKGGDGTALVMEFVEGPTLADLIAGRALRGSGLPASEALAIAREIAAALEAAHDQGIVHRDLKPANVKIRPDGSVKVLDFGLARAIEPGAGREPEPGGIADSPTVTASARTQAGEILGTASYMSPEQARGQMIDARSDVWAFGVVLFEMLSGRRPFAGGNAVEVLGAVLSLEPDWTALPRHVPPHVVRIVRACLQKHPKQRLASMQDVRLALEGAFDAHSGPGAASPRSSTAKWTPALVVAAAAIGVLVAALMMRPAEAEPPPVVRFSLDLPGDLRFRNTGRTVIAVSPDGRLVVGNTTEGLYLRSLDEAEGRLLPGTGEPLTNPFFSPDGRSVGYFQNGQLKRLALSGGAPVAIATAGNPSGATWTEDDTVFYALSEGIMRVPASGGTPVLVVPARSGELIDGPQLLEDGDSLLFSVAQPLPFSPQSPWDSAQVVVQSLRSGLRKTLLQGSDGRYVPTGHLVYALGESLNAVPFDIKALEVRGGAASLVQGVSRALGAGSANYVVTRDGTLVHAVGTGAAVTAPLTWVDRLGRPDPIATIPKARFSSPRLSADDRRVLVWAERNVRIYDLATGRETRVTMDGLAGGFVAWRPDDGMVAYSSARSSKHPDSTNVWLQRPDGTGTPVKATALEGQVDVDAWSPDGRTLAVHHHPPPGRNSDILMVPVADGVGAEPRPFAAESFGEINVVFSPDGRYVAYRSNETGQSEVYIRPFDGAGPKTPVSVGGASDLAWARNGEIFYLRPKDGMLIAVPVATTPRLAVGRPIELFRVAGLLYGSQATRFAVASDGKRLLMPAGELLPERGSSPRPAIHIVLNWAEELKRLVPRP